MKRSSPLRQLGILFHAKRIATQSFTGTVEHFEHKSKNYVVGENFVTLPLEQRTTNSILACSLNFHLRR
jgi:hypothetical protein